METIHEHLFLILTLIWVLTGFYWIAAAMKMKRAKKKESIGFRVFYMFFWYLPVVVTFFDILPEAWQGERLYPSNLLQDYLAFLLAVAGLAFMIWSRVTLGKNWSGRIAIKEDHFLITSGPYRFVRHPMYTGFIFAFLGSALLLGEMKGMISFVVLFIGIVMKVQLEEKFVIEAFGEEYKAYANRVKRLIPFIY